MVNEIYLALVHRPTSGAATGLASKVLMRTHRHGSRRVFADALDACEKLAQTLAASLARYEPELLGTYRFGKVWCSSLLEYLGILVNGEWQRSPLPNGPLNQALATTRLYFGTEAIEYRTPTRSPKYRVRMARAKPRRSWKTAETHSFCAVPAARTAARRHSHPA